MKLLILTLATAFTFTTHAAAPAVDAARAVKLADDYLAKRAPGGPHIVSATLESSALFKGGRSWVVRWSTPIGTGDEREVGVRVKLDGTLSRLVESDKARAAAAARRPYLR